MSTKLSFGDVSFSSYLNDAEETFVLQLTKSRQNSFSFPNHCHIPLGRNKSENGEIDVFSAEKYFNEPLEKFMDKRDDLHEVQSLRREIRQRTRSVRSESSWNSRSLLMDVKTPQQKPKGNNSGCRKTFLASLGCRCSCNDVSAIDVGSRSNQGESRKGAKNGEMKQFGNTYSNKQRNDPSSLEREVKMLAWDAIPPKYSNEDYNDTDSETSSDLFEIESFSTNYTNPYLARQTSDVTSGYITPTTCYAPGEASVQWSTVTASMADFSVSDSDELDVVPPRTSRSRKVREEKNRRTNKQMGNKLNGILSGCKSRKDVRVAGEAYRTTDLQMQHRMQNIKPMGRFQTESKLTGINRTNSNRFITIPLSESQFKRAPHMLYMH